MSSARCTGTERENTHTCDPNNTGACGTDEVPISVLKDGWKALALPITHLVNVIIASSSWPTAWKSAKVVPVLKPNKPRLDVGSYRPVALLPAISKLVEKVLQTQLSKFAEQHKLLPADQHGFRKGRSVDTALATVTARLAAAVESKHEAVLSAFDFSAAFDTVDRELLLKKMPWLDVTSTALLESYLTDRSQQVSWNGSKSTLIPVPYGVPQGSILDPLLFIFMTADLPEHLGSGAGGGGSRSDVTLYADDTSVVDIGPSKEELPVRQAHTSQKVGHLFCRKLAEPQQRQDSNNGGVKFSSGNLFFRPTNPPTARHSA